MDKNKKEKTSFILYNEYWDCLEGLDHAAIGKIFEAVFRWRRGEEVTINDPTTKVAFNFIKNQIVRDEKKYASLVKVRSEAGIKGNKSRWENRKTSQNIASISQTSLNENENENENDNFSNEKLHTPLTPHKSGGRVRKEKLEFRFYMWCFKRLTGRKYQEVPERERMFQARTLKGKFPLENMLTSLRMMTEDEYLMGKNEQNKVYATPDYHLRNDRQIAKFLEVDGAGDMLEQVRKELPELKRIFIKELEGEKNDQQT
jgi:hypothetical protein